MVALVVALFQGGHNREYIKYFLSIDREVVLYLRGQENTFPLRNFKNSLINTSELSLRKNITRFDFVFVLRDLFVTTETSLFCLIHEIT